MRSTASWTASFEICSFSLSIVVLEMESPRLLSKVSTHSLVPLILKNRPSTRARIFIARLRTKAQIKIVTRIAYAI